MGILDRIQATRKVTKLRESKGLDARALADLQAGLVAMGPAVIPSVLECLGNGDARGPAIEVLGTLLTNQSVSLYLDALSSPNPAISSGVARVLARSRSYDPTRVLPLLAATRPNKSVLESILREQTAAIPPPRILQIFPKLEKDGQAVAFRLLEKTQNEVILPGLMQLLGHPDWWVRMSAIRLLAQHAQDPVVSQITERLADENRTVRLEAVNALTKLGAKAAVPPMAACLRDADYMVQSAAVDFLIANAGASAVPLLLEVLTDESEYVRRAAIEVLNQVATTDAIQDLVRALRDEDWWVRVRAADALGTLGGDKVVDSVVGLLADPDESIRRHAVEILNAVSDERAVEPLIDALEDADWWVRERAIDALGKTKDERAVEPLLALLASDENAVSLCVRALGAIGDARAVPGLCRLVESEREDVRRDAAEALKSLLRTPLESSARSAVQAALGRLHDPSVSSSGTPLPVRRSATPSPWRLPRAEDLPSADGQRPAPRPVSRPMDVLPLMPASRVSSAPAAASGAAAPKPAGGGEPTLIADVNQLKPGIVLLDRYRVLKRIGHGGFGAVYLVEDAAIQEEVILKFLNPHIAIDADAKQRFVQELRLTRKITHKNVIRLHDFLALGSTHAVSMEYFPGEDLGQILAREKRLDPRRVLYLALQICEGLAAAHNVGVVHRDLKPPNILVGEADAVKIVDFGLAASQQQTGPRLTQSGVLIGSPEYMAPELISGEAMDARADIYSLGIVMYEAVSGCRPFTDETPVKVLFRHLEGNARPLGTLVPGIPSGLESLVARAMARDAAHRPANVEALHRLLEGQLEALEEAA